jgi:hypothetical protein
VIKAEELAARWAWSELSSSRFRDTYKATPELRAKADKDVAFASLSDEERSALHRLLKTHDDRGPLLYKWLMAYSSYSLQQRPYAAIRNVALVRGLHWMRFEDFATLPGTAEPGAAARAALAKVAVGQKVGKEHPIIVPCRFGAFASELMLDGTFRSLVFARDHQAGATMPVWAPTNVVLEFPNEPEWLRRLTASPDRVEGAS